MPESGVTGASAESGWVQVLEGSTFMLSDARGDVEAGTVAGLFHDDTRYLSKFTLTVDDEPPTVLSSGTVDYYSAAFFMTNPDLDGLPGGSLSIQRYRFVGGGLNEVVVVESHIDRPARVRVRLSCGADFADLFEVKQQDFAKRGRLGAAHDKEDSCLLFGYEHQGFSAGTRVHSTEPARIEGDDLLFDVELRPRGTWKTRIRISVRAGDQVLEPIGEEERAASMALLQWREESKVLQKWRGEVPDFEADWDLLELVYDKSIVDLAALRLYADVEGNEFSLPAAGLPWFMAIFGRDTIITSYMALPIGPGLARGALYSLAGLQGMEVNDFKDEEPGKILHEIRFGELSVLGETPHRPYYGTADATPLWLILLSEYWRFTGDDETCRELLPGALRALAWIDRYGDRDGDGYVEYETRSSQGLVHQGWKDSSHPVLFTDGRVAQPPIAMCEIQGYVYDAKLRATELAGRVWGDRELADRLRDEAETLRERFNRDFWLEDRGHYAEALDGEKRQVDSLTSNVGHLLWSGIVPEDRAERLVGHLFSEAMFSGWGVRTMSSDHVGYNPIAYHNGTVWPHDNALISAGLTRYGFREEANRIAVAMFEAAGFTDFRLPEVFAGYRRSDSRFPVRYPTASSPQAWATASPFLWLRLMVGLEAADGQLLIDPVVPKTCGRIRLLGLHAFGAHYDVTAEDTSGSIDRSAPSHP